MNDFGEEENFANERSPEGARYTHTGSAPSSRARFIPSGYAQEILALNPADRPICPYEQTEYNTAVSDALQSVTQKRSLAYARHIVHQLALAQVMVTRAGLALREAEFTKLTVITGEKYHMTTPKVAPALTAYERLERAWLRLLSHFDRSYVNYTDRPIDEEAYRRRTQSDAAMDPDAQTQHCQSMAPLDPKEFYQVDQARPAEKVGGPSSALAPTGVGSQLAHVDAADTDQASNREGEAPGEPKAQPRPPARQEPRPPNTPPPPQAQNPKTRPTPPATSRPRSPRSSPERLDSPRARHSVTPHE